MKNDDKFKTSGIVVETLRGSKFRVKLISIKGSPIITATSNQ